MFDINWIRENPEAFDRGLKRRDLPPESQRLISIDERRRAIIRVLESWQNRRNVASEKIREAKAKKDEPTAQKLMAEVAECKTSISTLEKEQKEVVGELRKALAEIPNLPADDVPDGKNEKGNIERKDHSFGKKPNSNSAKQHFELGGILGLMDFEAAAKLSGSRFVVLKGALARMERAISQFFLDVHTSEFGYTEVAPPLLVHGGVMFGTGQLPKFEDDQFLAINMALAKQDTGDLVELIVDQSASQNTEMEIWTRRINKLSETMQSLNYSPQTINATIQRAIEKYGLEKLDLRTEQKGSYAKLWLIPTAEVPLTNLVRESIVAEEELPLRYTACTPCFRAEAGAAGKDTRGMLRQHQFTKVELVSITTPEQSKDEHERMLSAAEEVLKRLGLHFRVMTLCTGDMGFASQKTYDIEVWLPGQNAYREISSCSNCGEFQARRMEARWRGKDGKVQGPVHTLNGSGVAVGRALIAVMENYQDESGAIAVPGVLQPYMGGLKKIDRVK